MRSCRCEEKKLVTICRVGTNALIHALEEAFDLLLNCLTQSATENVANQHDALEP